MQKIDLNPFREYLISRIRKGVTNGCKLFLEIKNQGFAGSYETLYRYFGDIHTSAMVLDRITQNIEVVNIEGHSYRLKDRA